MPIATNRRGWEVTTPFGKWYHHLRYGHILHPCGINKVFFVKQLVHQGFCDHDGDHVCDCGFSWPQRIPTHEKERTIR